MQLNCWTFVCPWAWLRTIELHGVTLAHSPLQNFFNVLTFKTALEETRGTLTADKLADLYDEHVRFANPDDAATCPNESNTTCRVIPMVIQADFVEIKHMNSMLVPFWPDQSRCLRLSLTRLARWATVFLVCSLLRISLSHSFSLHAWIFEVLCDPDIAQLLLHADEAEKKAFSHWSKYQILVQKGRTPEGIRWLFMAVSLDWTYIGFWNVLSLKKREFCQAQILSAQVWWTWSRVPLLGKAVDEKSSGHHLPSIAGPKALAAAYLGEDRHRLHRLLRSHQGCCLFKGFGTII